MCDHLGDLCDYELTSALRHVPNDYEAVDTWLDDNSVKLRYMFCFVLCNRAPYCDHEQFYQVFKKQYVAVVDDTGVIGFARREISQD